MKLIIGLGNIGAHYDGTRHNVGFAAVDAFAAANGLEWVQKDKFKASIAEGQVAGQKTILAKATTYYNLTGEAARAIKDFYKLDNTDILAIHDELALPFGTVRTRIGGSDAGNNGIKSLIAHLGGDFARIRIGIANDHLAHYGTADFVLAPLTHDERTQFTDIATNAGNLIRTFLQGEFAPTTLK
jgi:PTH1 family peptidyl-tRNA hydrolase